MKRKNKIILVFKDNEVPANIPFDYIPAYLCCSFNRHGELINISEIKNNCITAINTTEVTVSNIANAQIELQQMSKLSDIMLFNGAYRSVIAKSAKSFTIIPQRLGVNTSYTDSLSRTDFPIVTPLHHYFSKHKISLMHTATINRIICSNVSFSSKLKSLYFTHKQGYICFDTLRTVLHKCSIAISMRKTPILIFDEIRHYLPNVQLP